jgi:hypothetical protein
MTPQVKVILVVSDYWLIGSIAATDARIQDVLTRGDSDVLKLDHARLFNDRSGETPFATLTDILVPKKQIAFIGMRDEQHEAPLKRFNNFQTKVTSNICLIVDGYCIEGTAYLPTKTRNVSQSLYADGGQFLAVTCASIQSPNGRRDTLPLVLVNNHRTSVFSVPTNIDGTCQEPSTTRQSSKPAETAHALLRICEEIKHLVHEHDSRKETDFARHLDLGR